MSRSSYPACLVDGSELCWCLKTELALRFASMEEVTAALETVKQSSEDHVLPSVVVLPFTNVSPDKENECFGDGLTEEIIGSLSKVQGIRVIARASSFRFRGETDLARIGRLLNVTHTLDGSVRRAGNRVRISVQLTHIADESPLWGDRFDRDLTDIFAIQDEIAAAVVKSLEARLIGPQLANRTDVMAYSLALRA
jgi:TolB-like protein